MTLLLLFAGGAQPTSFERPGLLGLDGQPLVAGSRPYDQLIADVRFASAALLEQLGDDPRRLYKISPREFEEVVAELLRQQGYEITLTPAIKDGGRTSTQPSATPWAPSCTSWSASGMDPATRWELA